MSKNYFEETLYKASSTCDGSFRYISEFSKIYPFTTENIAGYIDYFDFDDKSLLTVGSSGDQILNAFSITRLVSFPLNILLFKYFLLIISSMHF